MDQLACWAEATKQPPEAYNTSVLHAACVWFLLAFKRRV